MLSIFQSEVNEAFGKAFEAFELHTTGGGGGLLGRVANLFCDNWMESEIWKLHGLFKVRGYNTKDHVVGVIFKSGLPPPERDLMRIKLAKPSSWKFCN